MRMLLTIATNNADGVGSITSQVIEVPDYKTAEQIAAHWERTLEYRTVFVILPEKKEG